MLALVKSAEIALSAVLLVAQRGQITVTELACALGIAPSTAHRALGSCRGLGLVRQDVRGGPYLIGPALHEMTLLQTSAATLRDAVEPVLRDLQATTGETVGVVILEGQTARVVQSLMTTDSGWLFARVGQVLPAHTTAGGKAILSALSADQVAQRYPDGLPRPLADGPVTTWAQLQRDLRVVARRGWAYSQAADGVGVGTIAAPITIASGEPVAALTVAAPLSRLGTRQEAEALAVPLLRATSLVQSRLRGGR